MRNYPDSATIACDEAASHCCETADPVKIITNLLYDYNETVGLYNKCKCDFWLRLCEDTQGDACDYAAEYCCGDYLYYKGEDRFVYLNSPLCYCDFFNYAQHALKPKALNINKEFSNPCGQLETSGILQATPSKKK
jgi:hypothetical protein